MSTRERKLEDALQKWRKRAETSASWERETGTTVLQLIDELESALAASVAEPQMRKVHISEIPGSLLNDGTTEMEVPVAEPDAAPPENRAPRDPHKEVPVWVIADVDEGIADLVRYLQTIEGVRTHASCQGTIGEGGPHPYRARVMCSWTPEAFEILKKLFDISFSEETNGAWGYVHPREGWKASARAVAEKAPAPPLSGRSLAYRFLELPHHLQIGIGKDLGFSILENESDADAFTRWFGLARTLGQLEKLGQLVAEAMPKKAAEKAAPAAPPLCTCVVGVHMRGTPSTTEQKDCSIHRAATPLNADEPKCEQISSALAGVRKELELSPELIDFFADPRQLEIDLETLFHLAEWWIKDFSLAAPPLVREETKK